MNSLPWCNQTEVATSPPHSVTQSVMHAGVRVRLKLCYCTARPKPVNRQRVSVAAGNYVKQLCQASDSLQQLARRSLGANVIITQITTIMHEVCLTLSSYIPCLYSAVSYPKCNAASASPLLLALPSPPPMPPQHAAIPTSHTSTAAFHFSAALASPIIAPLPAT